MTSIYISCMHVSRFTSEENIVVVVDASIGDFYRSLIVSSTKCVGKAEVSGILLRTYGVDSSNEVKKRSLNGSSVRIECVESDFDAAFSVLNIRFLFRRMS